MEVVIGKRGQSIAAIRKPVALLFSLGFDAFLATCWAKRHVMQHAHAFAQ
jgi:hypothetical protein